MASELLLPWARQPNGGARLQPAEGIAWASGLPAGRILMPANGSRLPCVFTSNSAGFIPSAAGIAFVGDGSTGWVGDRSLTSTIGTGDFAFLFVLTMGSTGTQILIGDTGGSTLFGVNAGNFYSYRGSFAGPAVTVSAPQRVLWTRVAGVEYIYANSAVTSAAAASSFASSGVTNLLCRASAGDYPATCSVALAACWPNRGLTASQARAVIANPWDAVYEPRRIWVPVSAGGSGTTISVPSGSLALTGFAPTVSATANQTIAVPAGALTLAGFAPTVNVGANQSISVPAGSLTMTGFAPTVNVGVNQNIAVPAGSLILTGFAPTISTSANQTIAVPVGSLTLTGFAPTVVQTAHQTISVPLGTLVMAGYAPTVSASGSYTISVPLGALVLTGYAPVVNNSGASATVTVKLGSWIRYKILT